MPPLPSNEPGYVCHRCIGDPFLAGDVKAEGTRHECMQCEKLRKALPFSELAELIHNAIEGNFRPGRDDEGQRFAELIAEQAEIPEELAEQVQSWFSSRRGYSMVRDGEVNIYEESWVEEGLDRDPYSARWRAFKRSVREEARFFNEQASAWLADIFHKLEEQADWQGRNAVRTIAPGDPGSVFVRGRVAQSDAELQKFLLDPVAELGPPPAGIASAGRMNAAGVSVFYGAFDLPTCRAEIRPPVGSHAVFASFRLLRPIKILDFEVLSSTAITGSIFDPAYRRSVDRGAFLRTFGTEISVPVMPRDEAFGYVPTQIVAEYLAHALGLDGIMFRSVQAGGATQNIVLFNRVARVKALDRSGYMAKIDLGWVEPDDYDDRITISEEELPPPPEEAPVEPADPDFFAMVHFDSPDENADDRVETLEYVPDSVVVQRVRAVDYDAPGRHVSRYRWTREQLDNSPF